MSIATVDGDPFEDGSVGLDIGIHTAHSPRLHVNHPLPDDREVYDAISLDGAAAHGFTSENVEVDVDQDIRQRQRQSIIPSTNPSERISTIRPVISPYSSSSATSKTSPPMMTITQSPPLPHSPPNPLSPHRRTIKGKERAWDLDIERGDERRFVEISRQEEKDDGLEVGKVYPPISDEEAEEKRIQENLAMFTARDMARRRAARSSRQYLPPSSSNNTSQPPTGFLGMSLGGLGRSTTKRGGMLGFLRLEGGGSEDGERDGKRDSEVALRGYPQPLPLSPHPSTSNPFDNPYSPSPHDSTAASDDYPLASPTRSTQPPIERQPTPLRPSTLAGPSKQPYSDSFSDKSPSHETPGFSSSARYDPIEDGYKGSTWRGGGSRSATPAGKLVEEGMRKDKWWYALCAWGNDLDDGEEGQAGRTNPFE